MKKTHLIVVGLILVTTLITNAQEKYSLSFTASPQICWLSSSSPLIQSDSPTLGLAGGVITDYFFQQNKRYSLHSGFIISKTGGNLKYIVSDTIQSTSENNLLYDEVNLSKTKVHYSQTNIEIPITLKLRTAQFRENIYYVQFGLINWIKVGEQYKADANYLDQINLSTKRYTLGGNIGAGLEHSIGHDNFVILGVTYHYSLTDITCNDVIADETTMNTARFQFGLVF